MLKNNQQKSFCKILFLFLLVWAGIFGFSKKTSAEKPIVVINELMWAGSSLSTADEFIELKNTSSNDVLIENWCLKQLPVTDKSWKITFSIGKSILANDYFLISNYKNSNEKSIVDTGIDLVDNDISLSNTGLQIGLYKYPCDDEGAIIDIAGDGSAPLEGENKTIKKSMERNEITGNGSVKDSWHTCFSATNLKSDSLGLNCATPRAKNSKKIEVEDPPIEPLTYSDKIYINELLPNPEESPEEKYEFVELFNASDEEVALDGWKLKDKTNEFNLAGALKAKSYLLFYDTVSLNNSGDEIELVNPKNERVDFAAYGSAKENVSYNFNGASWRWSQFLTPGAANKFNSPAETEIKIDQKIYAEVYADFAVSASDADGDKLKITWDFGDGHKSYKAQTRHKYAETGKYNLILKITDGSEDVLKNYAIEVEDYPHPKVRIIRFCPNPKGNDSDGEWIEVQNKSKRKINLNGWSVATGWKKLANHPIGTGVIIKPGKTVKLTRAESKFVLGNEKTKIELRYPDGEVAAKAKFKNQKSAKEDEIFAKEKGSGWKGAMIMENDEKDIEDVRDAQDAAESMPAENIEEELPKEVIEEVANIIGKQSRLRAVENKILAAVKQSASFGMAINIEEELRKEPLIIESNLAYVFTENADYAPPDHYAVKFLKTTLQKTNQFLNVILH